MKLKQDEFLCLYEPVHDRFERFCKARAYGAMEAKDLMNESLLIAYQKFEDLTSRTAFLSYLIGIAIKVLANTNRKKREDLIIDDGKSQFGESEQQALHDAEVYMLYKALDLLPIEQRESLILFEITGFSIKEIAGIHKVSESAVKQRLKRGRERLTTILTFESTNKTGEVKHG